MWCSNPSLLMENLGILSFLPTLLTELWWGLWWNSAHQPLLHGVHVGFLSLKVQFAEEVLPSVAVHSVCLWEELQGPLTWTSWVGTQFFSIRSWSEGLPRDISQHWKPQVTWPLNWLYLYATNVDSLPVKLKVIVRILPTVMQKRIMILKDMKKFW